MARGDLRPPTPDAAPEREQGGAWLRPFRRWDGYREAVAAALRQLAGREPEPDPVEEREEELVGR